MIIPIFQIDAFTDKLFGGNPAAVCPLDFWLPNDQLQSIALENNLSETAFFVEEQGNYHIRWFTPKVEVDLCGHATLASAHVLFNHLACEGDKIIFNSKSGKLVVKREGEMLTLDFPGDTISQVEITSNFHNLFGSKIKELWKGRTDYLVVLNCQKEVEDLKPDLKDLAEIQARGIIVTAPGEECDFVSRFFAPQSGVDEDPVTGSAHTTLTNYWSSVLNKNEFNAIQVSSRRGFLKCKLIGKRVEISGKCRTYMIGEVYLE
jgi:PhzF family phenazine biosynthesis protein